MEKLTTKLTVETDNGRPASSPSLIVKPTGQKFVFYTKQFTSGRTSDSNVTFTLPNIVNIEAGSGTLNSIVISWSAVSPTVSYNSFDIVYVDSSGNVIVSDTWDMTTIASSIVLAYVYVGGSAITSLEQVEKMGLYVYSQKQVLVGSVWQWIDQEYLVNTGEQPRAFYDQASDKIYLQYKKDSSVYLRIFDPSDELSWRYIPNTFIQAPNIVHLNRDPQASIQFIAGAGDFADQTVLDAELFPLSATGLSFQLVSTVFESFIYIPYLTGSYLQYLHYPYTIEIGHLSGGNFVVEDSVVMSDNDTYDRWHKWTGTLGLKYLRVRCFSSLMGGEYFTPPANYKQVLIFDPFEYQETIGNTENIQILTEPVNFEASSAKLGQIIKTFEYEESRDFEQDAVLFEVGTGSFGQITKTFEYEESRDFEQDTIPAFQVGAGYSAIMTTVNIS
jgi:hypothetical protein